MARLSEEQRRKFSREALVKIDLAEQLAYVDKREPGISHLFKTTDPHRDFDLFPTLGELDKYDRENLGRFLKRVDSQHEGIGGVSRDFYYSAIETAIDFAGYSKSRVKSSHLMAGLVASMLRNDAIWMASGLTEADYQDLRLDLNYYEERIKPEPTDEEPEVVTGQSFTMWVNPGDASIEDLKELFEAMSAYNVACGGTGLSFTKDEEKQPIQLCLQS